MTDEKTDGLTPANQNPWYVLMTLYGEQEGPDDDEKLDELNRRAWNAWAGQMLNKVQLEDTATSLGIDLSELKAWPVLEKDITSRFQAVWSKRNPTLAAPSLAVPDREFSLLRVHFSKRVLLKKRVFPSTIIFTKSEFSRGANFTGSKFFGEAWFDSATFASVAWFNESEFRSISLFAGTRFAKTASFMKAVFAREAWFSKAEFDDTTQFQEAIFEAEAQFWSASFSSQVRFDGATFQSVTFFAGVAFLGFSYFIDTRFGDRSRKKTVCRPVFTETQFEKPCSFRDARFATHYPVLNGTNLHPLTNFTAKKRGADGPFWPDVTPHTPFQAEFHLPKNDAAQPAEEARDSLAAIRHNVANQGLPEAQHFFFRREMHFAGRAGTRLQGLPYKAFWALSDYGHGIGRPAFILLAIWALGVVAIFQIGVPTIAHCPNPFVHSASTSLNFFGFLRGYYPDCARYLPDLLKTVSSAQTFASYVMLFFLGLGLRQRFRLR